MTIEKMLVVVVIILSTSLLPAAVVLWAKIDDDEPDKKILDLSKRVFWAGAVFGFALVWLFYRMS